MRTEARFPSVDAGAGHYESFYLKATRPGGGQGFWIRHTVHQRPGEERTASLWFTLFDAEHARPRATKLTVGSAAHSAPAEALIEVAGAVLEPGRARGAIEEGELPVSWDLSFTEGAAPFRHLPYEFLYRAPLPKTKLLSPWPDSRYEGTLTVAGENVEVNGWPGMVGHNWGTEHAERWTWIQANDFRESKAYFDAALGRIKIGPLTTPWIGNAVVCLDGVEHRLGGLDRLRSTKIADRPTSCDFELAGKEIRVRGRVGAEPRNFVGWVYADPVGPAHNTLNCSISDLELIVERKGRAPLRLNCTGAAAYEIGMRETDHGIEIQPFGDG